MGIPNMSLPELRPVQMESPMDQYAKALQLRQLQQQGQIGGIQLQQGQQELKDQQAFRDAMTDPSMKGKTIGEVADALAQGGHISQASWATAKKADLEQRKSLAEVDEKTLANRIKSHEITQNLYNNVMNMQVPDDQPLPNWADIAQQYDSIPGNKPILDPAKPLTKQQIGQMGPMLDMHDAYLASEVAKRKAANEAKTSGMKEAGNVLYDVTGEKPVAVAGNPPVEQQELAAWLARPENKGKTAADFLQAKGTHTSTQSDSLGVTSSTTTAPGLNRGARGPASSLPAPGLLPPGSGKMTPQQVKEGIVDLVGQYKYNASNLFRLVAKHPDIMAAVSQKYPDWDQTTYNAKNKLMTDYTSGVHSKELNAVNTTLGHVAELGDAIDALKNGDIKFLNSIANKYQIQTGGTPAATVGLIARRLGPEIATVYTPSGGGQAERFADEKDFDASLGPDILKANVSKTVDLLRSKIGSLENQYKNTVGRDDFAQRFITPQAKGALQKYSSHAGGSPGGITVTDPRGTPHTFPNQQAADAFKKAAGIQ